MDHPAARLFDRLRLPLQLILQAHPDGLSEHQLLTLLAEQDEPLFEREALRSPLTLFQSHFLLFHLLYRLRDQLHAEQLGTLEIDCLKIRLHEGVAAGGSLPAPPDPLRAYYLDLGQLDETGEAEVIELLERFWCRYAAHDQRAEALAVLGLEGEVDRVAITRRYRELAMRHHPDRGGSTAELQRINAAVALLRRLEG